MIYDTIENLQKYLPQDLRKEVLGFLASLTPEIPVGKHAIRGEDIFVNVNSYTTEPAEKRPWEAHRKYIDIQYALAGSEFSQQFPTAVLAGADKEAKYDAENDVIFFKNTGAEVNAVLLSSDVKSFAVFFPQDAHKPGISVNTPVEIKKVIFKIDAKLW
ncbi:MAG: YhcH/YjgK/YiaL family protein [Planctomycetaceae bacterium]|nr:YhcH/YjgK/YiaL family protein [Planctomycetaceae bacterium]